MMPQLRRMRGPEVWTVLYHPAPVPERDSGENIEPPESYLCLATDDESAEDYCLSANPGCEVLFVREGSNVDLALLEYEETRFEDQAVAA